MTNSSFSPRGFGFGSFVAVNAAAGIGVNAGIGAVQEMARSVRDQAQRNRVVRIIRQQREDSRELRRDLAVSRAESAIRLWHLQKREPSATRSR